MKLTSRSSEPFNGLSLLVLPSAALRAARLAPVLRSAILWRSVKKQTDMPWTQQKLAAELGRAHIPRGVEAAVLQQPALAIEHLLAIATDEGAEERQVLHAAFLAAKYLEYTEDPSAGRCLIRKACTTLDHDDSYFSDLAARTINLVLLKFIGRPGLALAADEIEAALDAVERRRPDRFDTQIGRQALERIDPETRPNKSE